MNQKIYGLAHSEEWKQFSQWVTILLGVVLFTLVMSGAAWWLSLPVAFMFVANALVVVDYELEQYG